MMINLTKVVVLVALCLIAIFVFPLFSGPVEASEQEGYITLPESEYKGLQQLVSDLESENAELMELVTGDSGKSASMLDEIASLQVQVAVLQREAKYTEGLQDQVDELVAELHQEQEDHKMSKRMGALAYIALTFLVIMIILASSIRRSSAYYYGYPYDNDY